MRRDDAGIQFTEAVGDDAELGVGLLDADSGLEARAKEEEMALVGGVEIGLLGEEEVGFWLAGKPVPMTPMTVKGSELSRMARPMMPGSLPKRRFQRPFVRTTTRGPPGRSSSGEKVRPITGVTPNRRK